MCDRARDSVYSTARVLSDWRWNLVSRPCGVRLSTPMFAVFATLPAEKFLGDTPVDADMKIRKHSTRLYKAAADSILDLSASPKP